MATVTESAYVRSGVDAPRAEEATAGLVEILSSIVLDRPRLAALASGHYANVLQLTEDLGLALSMDGVGSKAIVAERMRKFDTIGIDCIAMNVNDIVCVGARPVALLDYISVQDPDPTLLREIARGLKTGAEDASIEIPGGEVAQLPDMIKGHPSNGFDLVGACVGLVQTSKIVTGDQIQPGDVIVAAPSSGVHANGLTLARSAFEDLDEPVTELGGTVGEALLTPTVIYVRAALDLLGSDIEVRGLAHITSKSFRNLLRLNRSVGYELDAISALPKLPIFDLIAERADRARPADMWETFNMGCGFCCIVPSSQAEAAVDALNRHHAGSAVVGRVTEAADRVALSEVGLVGTSDTPFQPVA